MSAYYNEHDKHAAAWLRELIKRGLIANGVVDERSIVDVRPSDLAGFVQCHFFAGIGGWSLALRLAKWADSRPVWTGSAPCQPFSAAGAGKGKSDERHLWPVFFALIKECAPGIVFGEQVASSLVVGKVGGGAQTQDGPVWLDGVFADLESAGYTTGASVLGAHSVGAPHIRQRLYWLGHSTGGGCGVVGDAARSGRGGHADGAGESCRLADGERAGLQGHAGHGDGGHEPGRLDALAAGSASEGGAVGRLGDASRLRERSRTDSEGGDGSGGIGLAGTGTGSDAFDGIEALPGNSRGIPGNTSRVGDANGGDASAERQQCGGEQRLQPHGDERGHWDDAYWLLCRDGKHRRVSAQSALFPLSDGLPYKLARRGSIRPALLKGAGNAIVPTLAAEFIRAFEELNQFSANQNPT